MALIKSVVIGSGAVKSPTAVSESVIIGTDAGHNHQNGEYNIIIGKSAGKNANGSENIYIGHATAHNCQGSGNIVIGPCVTQPLMSNTLIFGKGPNRVLVASLDTGLVSINSMYVAGNITYGGELIGNLPWNIPRVTGTNIGISNLEGTHMVCFGENTSTRGSNVVALGNNAGHCSYSTNLVAIGNGAGEYNTGHNVIAIGAHAGTSNIKSDKLFIGDYIEADNDVFHINRNMTAGGWNIGNGELVSDGVALTRTQLTLSSAQISSERSRLITSGGLSIKTRPVESNTRHTFQNEKGVFVSNVKTHEPFKTLFRWKSMFVGLGTDGHVYTSKIGTVWIPIRSPNLKLLTFEDDVLLGYGGQSFYRYENAEWTEEVRDDEGKYDCFSMCGGYAFGTKLSNSFFEDEGTILFRAGNHWRLYPGVYLENYTFVKEILDSVYVGGEEGTYELKDRRAVPTNVAIQKEEFSFTETGNLECPDLNIPDTLNIGKYSLQTNSKGVEITDGIHTGQVYDTAFNTIPIHLDGIMNITVKKNGSGKLLFEVTDKSGITTHTLDSL
jgi:hypothetical protein